MIRLDSDCRRIRLEPSPPVYGCSLQGDSKNPPILVLVYAASNLTVKSVTPTFPERHYQ